EPPTAWQTTSGSGCFSSTGEGFGRAAGVASTLVPASSWPTAALNRALHLTAAASRLLGVHVLRAAAAGEIVVRPRRRHADEHGSLEARRRVPNPRPRRPAPVPVGLQPVVRAGQARRAGLAPAARDG